MRTPLPIVAAAAVVLSVATGAVPPLAAQVPAEPGTPQHLRPVPLTITTRHGRRRFSVEVARTSGEQEVGLMFRKVVPVHEGMIFPMQPVRPASFWMKNTLVPLDMLFIRADGTIARIAANTVPLSLATVESGEPVAAVLELAGGVAATQGIAAGDKVRWSGRPAG